MVSVAPRVLMVEAQCVQELVLNDPTIETTKGRQREHLLTSLSADSGPAPTVTVKDRVIGLNPEKLHYILHFQYFHSALTPFHS